VHEAIAELQQAVIKLINIAQQYGIVCIVTNAVPGWVEKTIKRWLPELKQYIWGHGLRPPIPVYYAQEAYTQPGQRIADLDWVDELGEYMWWKKAAMVQALEDLDSLYRLREGDPADPLRPGQRSFHRKPVRVTNIFSIGDSEAEMQAAVIAVYNSGGAALARTGAPASAATSTVKRTSSKNSTSVRHRKGAEERRRCTARARSVEAPGNPSQPLVKLIRYRECAHVRRICLELEQTARLLPTMVMINDHLRIDLCPNSVDLPGYEPLPLNHKVQSLKEIGDALTSHGIDIERFDTTGPKTLEGFVTELENGTAQIMVNLLRPARPLRVVSVVLVRLFSNPRGHILVESRDRSGRNSRLPGTKKRPSETTKDVARRYLLECFDASVSVILDSSIKTFCEEEQDSLSFPGILTVYHKEIVQCYLEHFCPGGPTSSKVAQRDSWPVSTSSRATKWLMWMPEEEARKKNLNLWPDSLWEAPYSLGPDISTAGSSTVTENVLLRMCRRNERRNEDLDLQRSLRVQVV